MQTNQTFLKHCLFNNQIIEILKILDIVLVKMVKILIRSIALKIEMTSFSELRRKDTMESLANAQKHKNLLITV